MTEYGLRVVSQPEVAAGFALAGLKTIEVATPAAGADAIRGLLTEPSVGVALVEDACYNALAEDLRRQVGRRPLPLLVPFPGPRWKEQPGLAESYIVELLHQVIGYRVRLR